MPGLMLACLAPFGVGSAVTKIEKDSLLASCGAEHEHPRLIIQAIRNAAGPPQSDSRSARVKAAIDQVGDRNQKATEKVLMPTLKEPIEESDMAPQM